MPRDDALNNFFHPASVAVVGASRQPGKVGHHLLHNMLSSGFQGRVYPVNPQASEILGQRCYPTVLAIPEPVDLAIIVVPAPAVLPVIEQCGQKGIHAAIIISAGFKESGPEGVQRERQLALLARQLSVRIIGPNCLGVMSTAHGLNATFARGFPKHGPVSLMSQSGALATAIIDWSIQQGIGYSSFVSFGNGVDVGVVDLLHTWEDDPDTRVILAYIEGLPDGPHFMQVAHQVSQKKPIIVVKAGSTEAGARAVSSHTGSLAGSEQAYDAAFAQCGVIRARSMEHLFDLASAFAYQPIPRGPRVGIITNAGGPGIIATDAVEHASLRLASIEPDIVARLRTQLSEASNFYNPIDVLGDADAARYTFAAETLLADSNVDAVLALLTPQAMTDPNEMAQGLARVAAHAEKPLLACFMGGDAMAQAIDLLQNSQVPNYPYPERAVDALSGMVHYREWLQQPSDELPRFRADHQTVRAIFAHTRAEGRVNLSELEAREVLRAYGIAVPQSEIAETPEQAAEAAATIGFPVVMKIVSPDILHKSDIGGVRMGIRDRQEAVDAYELMMLRVHRFAPTASLRGVLVQEMIPGTREVILGSSRDPQFGPLVMFGLGGIYVEVLKDISFRVAPFGKRHARRMLDEIRSAPLLHGARGERPCDIEAIIQSLLLVSQMVTDFPEIVEMDINPLKVGDPGAGVVAVDARITIAE